MAGSVGPAGACELSSFVRLVDNRVGAMRLDGAEAVPFSGERVPVVDVLEPFFGYSRKGVF